MAIPAPVLILGIAWPARLVAVVHKVRDIFEWFSSHAVIGVPLDWPVRFLAIGGLYSLLRTRLSRQKTIPIVLALLIGKELFDIVAHQDLFKPRPPDWGDLADILSGLAGMRLAMLLERKRRLPRPRNKIRSD